MIEYGRLAVDWTIWTSLTGLVKNQFVSVTSKRLHKFLCNTYTARFNKRRVSNKHRRFWSIVQMNAGGVYLGIYGIKTQKHKRQNEMMNAEPWQSLRLPTYYIDESCSLLHPQFMSQSRSLGVEETAVPRLTVGVSKLSFRIHPAQQAWRAAVKTQTAEYVTKLYKQLPAE